MVDRGGCSFVTKTRNIAHAGGKAAIIIDDKNENVTDIKLSDDGTGAGLRIPAVMISKQDGQTLKTFIENAQNPGDKNIKVNVHF